MKVGARRNQCRGCGLYFNSTSAFEMHRIGKYGVDRRCKTPEEMKAADMHLNKDGYWAGKGREDHEFND